jgi:hypothetical protein
MPKKKFLDQRLVTEFAEFRALKTKIEKWLDARRDEFLAKLDEGFECPAAGPFLLVVEPSSKPNIDWKQELFQVLKTNYVEAGSEPETAEQLATVKMTQMEIAAGKTPTKKLATKTNPSFGGKVLHAIVKKLNSKASRGF